MPRPIIPMPRWPGLGLLLGLVAVVGAPRCHRKQTEECPRFETSTRRTPAAEDPVVAEVNGRPVSASQVSRRAAEQGLDRRAALDSLIDEELLVEEAERRGLDRDPEVVLAAKQAAVYRLLREGFEREYTVSEIPEEDLHKLYRLNARNHFRRPEGRRFSHLFAPRPWRRVGRRWVLDRLADDRLRARFEALHADIAAAGPKTWREFETWASGDRNRGLPLTAERGTKAKDQLQPPFAEALFGLAEPGAVSGVITTRANLHIAFLVEVLPPINISFEEARDTLLERHFPEARRHAFQALVKRARERCTIQVRPENLPVSE